MHTVKHATSQISVNRFGWIASTLLIFGACHLASAQGTGAIINPISYFQVQEGSSAVSWSQTGATLDSTTGNSVITFQDTNGGTSTMIWLANGTLETWTITSGGNTQTYGDGIAQGQVGSFVLTSGTSGTNNVLAINGHPYLSVGSIVKPTATNGQAPGQRYFEVMYNGHDYGVTSYGTDYLNTSVYNCSSAAGTCVLTQNQGLQLYFGDGTYASYAVNQTGITFAYQTASTARNLLTQVNDWLLTAAGNTLSLPAPIVSFVCGGSMFTLSGIDSQFDAWLFSNASGTQYSALADANQDGSLADIYVYTNYGGQEYFIPSSILGTYSIYSDRLAISLTAINGIPYVQQGTLLVPQGPVSAIAYGGSSYSFAGYSQATDGNWLATYQTSGTTPVTATVEYSPSNNSLVKMQVNAPSGGTATYVDGATVGQPGAYVWSSASTAANSLTGINGGSYNPSGNSDLPGTATSANGIFTIKGNFMSLGSWTDNANQSGLDLSYYDGQTSPANIEFTANRPSSIWTWDAASNDGTIVNAVMQVDETSRLLLYPQADPTATAATLPEPSIVLDPNPNGVSHFNGTLTIPQQGDLQMGEFTATPSPSPTP